MTQSAHQQLHCPACQWAAPCAPPQMVQRLRSLGMLKRQADPEPAYLEELLRASAGRLSCPGCGRKGLMLSAMDEHEWESGRPCEACGKSIETERLEAFPQATRCLACQRASDAGGAGAAEYCPHCGAAMQVRPAGGSGIARYVLSCPECGRRE